MSKYPAGAMWKGNDGRKFGVIWLQERNEYFEIWRWAWRYSDGSGGESDWNISYRLCREEMPIAGKHRFKRVTDESL